MTVTVQAVQHVQTVQVVERFEGLENRPDSDVVAEEFVNELEAALEQFREIAADLGRDD
jgi:hypothetical protein